MATAIINAHPLLSRRVQESWHIDAMTVAGPPSLSGRVQVVRSPAPVWRAKIQPVVTEETRKYWHAFLSSLSGRGKAIRLSILTGEAKALLRSRFGFSAGTSTPHSDGTFFSDGSGYAPPPVALALAVSAAAFDSILDLDLRGLPNAVEDGDYLGIGGSAYHITGIYPSASGRVKVSVEPLLRKSVTAGAEATLLPTVVMRLTDDMQGRIERNAGNPIITSTIDLIEVPELS